MLISSPSNSAIKRIRALRHRKDRDRSHLFFAEGIRVVTEAVETAAHVETCVYAPDLLTSSLARALVSRLKADGCPCLEVTPKTFESLSLRENPQGIGAVIHQDWTELEDVQIETGLCWTALDAIQDPGNLGSTLRTSDAVGGAGVILLGNCTDPYDPVSVRASMGAIFSQRVVRTSFEQFSGWVSRHGYKVIGTSDAAEAEYRDVCYQTPLVLLMGSEREGLSEEQRAICNQEVKIPMAGRSDSLNLAVATGIVLYEIFAQRRRESG